MSEYGASNKSYWQEKTKYWARNAVIITFCALQIPTNYLKLAQYLLIERPTNNEVLLILI